MAEEFETLLRTVTDRRVKITVPDGVRTCWYLGKPWVVTGHRDLTSIEDAVRAGMVEAEDV